jgi:hypothetical protein
MNEFKNRAFALLNAWTTGEVSPLAELLSPQFEEIDRPEATAVGLEGLRHKLALFHRVHTDITLSVRKQVADGDLVCTQWLITATVRTPDDPKATQPQVVQFPGMSWTYFVNGKIVKNRVYRDIVGLLVQRGFQWALGGAKTPAQQEAQQEAHQGARQEAPSGGPGISTQGPPAQMGTTSSPKASIRQLVAAASGGTSYEAFMLTHLAEGVQGTVSPRYLLNKAETIQRFAEVFAMTAGGTVSLVTAVEEGSAACARVVLLQKKHNLKYTQNLNPLAEVVVDVSLWLEINEAGQIVQLHLVGDMLTPGMARGMKMVRAPSPAVETATA